MGARAARIVCARRFTGARSGLVCRLRRVAQLGEFTVAPEMASVATRVGKKMETAETRKKWTHYKAIVTLHFAET